eukprot:249659_1
MDEVKDESIGIVAMESYFPKYYVSQSKFEAFNGVSAGKYTLGLGQERMSFVTEREDICSISLTVLSNLLSKNKISYDEIGWICVATETIIDHSKSISSMLMQTFEENGCYNTEIEGIDVKHACYGGTFALFCAFDRISSKYWDGKYCIVISADIAEYAQGSARCTGGCGAVAMLIGRNGCIELNPLRASYKANQFDFYKPNLNSPYPVVNGPLSNECYLNALDSCYTRLKSKYDKRHGHTTYTPFTSDYWIFHAPYNKLVSKAFGRVIYNDFRSGNSALYYDHYKNNADMTSFLEEHETGANSQARPVIKGFEKIAKPWYKSYVEASTVIPKQIGNCYTASIFMGLLSLICNVVDVENDFCGKNVSVFSYGSGTMASLYSFKIHSSPHAVQQLKRIVANNEIHNRLKQRVEVACDEFTQILNDKAQRESQQFSGEFVPHRAVNEDSLYLNTYYLSKIDSNKQRFYKQFVEEEDDALKLPNLAQLVESKLSKCVQTVVDAADSALSTKDAIKIENVVTKSTQAITKCSYS